MEPLKKSHVHAFLTKIVQYRFLLMMTITFFSGVVLMLLTELQHWGEVSRDFGIGLFVAGTVGLGVEFFARKEMEKEFGDLTSEAIEDLTGPRFEEVVGLLREADHRSQATLVKLEEIRNLIWSNGLRDFGVLQIYPNRDEANLIKWIDSAKPGSVIRLLALCLTEATTHAYKKMIRKKLSEGCRLKILLLDPCSPFLDQRALEEPGDREEFKRQVRTGAAIQRSFVQYLEPEISGQLELMFYRAAPVCFIADNDSTMLVGAYLHGGRGDDCPHLEFEIKPGGVYERFRMHFESLWARGVILEERRGPEPPVDRRGLYAVDPQGASDQQAV